MVKVYFESRNHAELVALFSDEEHYDVCIDALVKLAESKDMILTESVEEEPLIENPMLELLKDGGKITFPSGYFFQGNPGIGYIEVNFPHGRDGLELLNEEGFQKAMIAARSWETYTKEEEEKHESNSSE